MKDKQQAAVRMFIVTPKTPNFLITDRGSIPIQNFSDNDLAAIGKTWTANLINAAKAKRKP